MSSSSTSTTSNATVIRRSFSALYSGIANENGIPASSSQAPIAFDQKPASARIERPPATFARTRPRASRMKAIASFSSMAEPSRYAACTTARLSATDATSG